MGGLRYANIGIAVAAAILLLDVIFLRHAARGVIQAVGLVAFVSAFVVYHFLDERAKRRSKRSQ